MPEDLRPAPRLPLDTADYVTAKQSGLDVFVNFEPGEPVAQVSLLETNTPQYWASAFDRQVYRRAMVAIFADSDAAFVETAPVMAEFANVTPRPPQWYWEHRE